jgi:hypothetical protein
MSPNEFLIYTLIILLADHHSGTWLGSSKALSPVTGWSIRQCQAVVRSLRDKGYIQGECKKGLGSYRIQVVKYFEAHTHAQLHARSAPGCASLAKEAHPGATLQEEGLQEVGGVLCVDFELKKGTEHITPHKKEKVNARSAI